MELSLRALEEAQRSLSGAPPPTHCTDPSSLQSAPSLMSFATKGAGRIPLHAVVQFVRLARSNSQKEVMEILADPVIQVAKVWNKIIVLYLSGQSVVYLSPVHFCKITVCTYTYMYMYVHVKYSYLAKQHFQSCMYLKGVCLRCCIKTSVAVMIVILSQRSEDTQARFRAQALELILAVDSLRSAHKKYKVRIAAAQGGPPSSLSGSVGVAGHAPPPPHPPPTAGTTTTTTTTTNAAAGSAGQQTLSSTSDEGGKSRTTYCN